MILYYCRLSDGKAGEERSIIIEAENDEIATREAYKGVSPGKELLQVYKLTTFALKPPH